MPSLSSLIVQRQVATVLEVEQAIARQVIHGGDLVTNLLEVAPACEPGLNAVLGESVGLPPAPWGRLPAPESDVLDLIPAELCLAHGFFPLRLERQNIVIASPTPLAPAVEDTLRFSLAKGLTQLASPMIRVREGIAAHYGIPLDARLLKLVQKLDDAGRARGRGLTSVPPPISPGEETAPLSLPRPPSMFPSTLESGVPSEEPDESGWDVPVGAKPKPPVEPIATTPEPVAPAAASGQDTDERASQIGYVEASEARRDAAREDLGREELAREEETSPPPPREIYPPRSPVVPRSAPPPTAGRPTMFDPMAQERADAMGAPSERFSPVEQPEHHPMRDTVPTPMEAVDAMEASLLGPSGRPDLLHPDALTRHAPEVVSFDEPAPSTEPEEEPVESFVSEPPPAVAPPVAVRVEEVGRSVEPADEVSATPREATARASERPPAEEIEDSPPPPSILNARAVHRLLRRELLEKKRGRSARRKGPFARADAERELEAASTPEELVDVFFAFVSQFFEYSALFLVHGDIAEGRDAFGPGADREKVLGIGVPLDLPSSFQRARSEGVVVFTRMNEDDLDLELRKDLGRVRAPRASQGAILPVTLRGRAVALLYGDDGANDVIVSQLGDTLGFAALASANLERIALMKKRGQVPSKRRPEASNVAALARAFSLPGADDARASQPPVPVVSPGARSVEPPPMPRELRGNHGSSTEGGAHDADSGRLTGGVYGQEARAERVYGETAYARTMDADDVVEAALARAREGSTKPSAHVIAQAHVTEQRQDVTRGYDDGAFEPRPVEPVRIAAPPVPRDVDASTLLGPGPASDSGRRVVEIPSHGYPGPRSDMPPPLEPPTAKVDRGRPPSSPPLRREEEDDASSWLVEQGGTPQPPRAQRRAEYAIIPDRAQAHAESTGDPRARDAALYGPYGPLLMKATLGGIQAEEALAELEREAEHSLAKLVAVFPGPLLVDRFRLRDQLPPASDCGPLLRLLVMVRRHALGFMTVRSTSPDVEQRFWATHVLGELTYPEASPAVLPRLFDDDVMVRRVARRAATALVSAGAAGEPLRTSLENMIKNQDEPVHRRVLAIEAMGEIRSGQMIPVLVEALSDPSDDVVEAARCSLMLLSRQDLGDNARSWEAWWLLNRERHRIEWLIDALTHDAASMRRAAGDELKAITKEYFGYYDDLPPRERERAQQKYREWWSDEGQFRFR